MVFVGKVFQYPLELDWHVVDCLLVESLKVYWYLCEKISAVVSVIKLLSWFGLVLEILYLYSKILGSLAK